MTHNKWAGHFFSGRWAAIDHEIYFEKFDIREMFLLVKLLSRDF